MSPATVIGSVPQQRILPSSIVTHENAEFGLDQRGTELQLVVVASRTAPDLVEAFQGEVEERLGRKILVGPTNLHNAAALRARLPWLGPHALGLRTSFGFGDRLGRATIGHVKALRAVGGDIAPVFAQQSIREMSRTGRSPEDVLAAAMWGAFAAGWTEGFGADADHLKHPADIDVCLAAGFTMFTIDPGEHVGNVPPNAGETYLRAATEALPWHLLEDSPSALGTRYVGRAFEVESTRVEFTEHTLQQAAVKYGRAIAHVTTMFRHLVNAAGGRPVELEISVDETDAPTSPAEHYYVASELRRLGVKWVSLAPRLVGRFEKGVDYIGDVGEFETDWGVHAAIARQLGPYKLSLHSGSDKFSVYDVAARQSRGAVHVKTAGTSYLEALRTIASADPALFREIYEFARDRYGTDRATYHVSASVEAAPASQSLDDAALPALLENFHVREILHVTFGSVLTAPCEDGASRFRDRLMADLTVAADEYAAHLEAHFVSHLTPFAGPRGGQSSHA